MKKALLHFVKIFTCIALLTNAVPSKAQIVWQHCYGGTADDLLEKGIRTLDGGYIFTGYTRSNNGDADSNHGVSNVWVVKIAASGAVQWENCYGGSMNEVGYDILQNPDSSYVIVGSCSSTNGDVSGLHGETDIWFIRLSPTGSLLNQKCIGGSYDEEGNSILKTADGGYIIAGTCDPTNLAYTIGDLNAVHVWLVKLSATDSIEWAKVYGGSHQDVVRNIIPTLDGGYIFCGNSYSNEGDVTGHHGDSTTPDIWVVKLSDTGAIQWEKSLGGSYKDRAGQILQNADSSYIIACSTQSWDGDVTYNPYAGPTNESGWIIKLAPDGVKLWDKCLNYYGYDGYFSISQTHDNGYVCTGYTTPSVVIPLPTKVWATKISDTGHSEWNASYGGSGGDAGLNVYQNSDSSYTVFGNTNSNDSDVSGNHGAGDGWVFQLGKTTSVKTVHDVIGVSIYPNPVDNYVTISSLSVLGVVSIWSMVGQLVTTISSNVTTVTTDVSNLPPGIYLININNRTTARFLKK
jgi:Secretion system C-terminal sorting domain